MFAAADQDWEIEEAYMSCQATLDHFSAYSLQAARNADILKSLYRAIIKQRQVLTTRNREKSGTMVGKIMNISARIPAQDIGAIDTGALPSTSPTNDWLQDFTFLDDSNMLLTDDTSFPWQNVSSQMWDNFMFDSAPTG
jgi:hypothetical protein